MVARLPVAGRPRRTPSRSRRRGESGAIAVEFALIMPVLLMLVFGILEFGFMINRDMIVGNASRDGARAASLNGTYAEIHSTIANELNAAGVPSGLPKTTIVIDCRKPGGAPCNATSGTYNALAVAGSTAVIRVTYNHALITPFISSILGSTRTLEQKTEMRVE